MILSGCGSSKYEPVAINEETDKCAMCSMQVKDDAYATQLTTTDGKTYKFDDIGCMNEWKGKNEAVKIGAEYVRDFNDMEWIAYRMLTMRMILPSVHPWRTASLRSRTSRPHKHSLMKRRRAR